MTEEEKVAEEVQKEGATGDGGEPTKTVTEEIKVQAEDLFQTLNDVIREGTAKRVTIMRNDRVLVDIPLALGIGASLVLAFYMPVITALVGVGALLTGCTLRIERDEPPEA
jgi:hypothetical protein